VARRASGRRTDYDWTFSAGAALAQTTLSPAGVALFTAGNSQTIVRTRGELLVWLDAAPAAGDLVRWAAGMHIVPPDFGSATTASPIADPNYSNWFWFATGSLASEDTAVADTLGIKATRVIIDNKAMRRLKADEQIQIVFEQETIGTAQAVNFSANLRILTGF